MLIRLQDALFNWSLGARLKRISRRIHRSIIVLYEIGHVRTTFSVLRRRPFRLKSPHKDVVK
jgi:hypothetical protein